VSKDRELIAQLEQALAVARQDRANHLAPGVPIAPS
jgi:hypothetical protein